MTDPTPSPEFVVQNTIHEWWGSNDQRPTLANAIVTALKDAGLLNEPKS